MRKSGIKRVVWTRPVRTENGEKTAGMESIAFLAVARALGGSFRQSKVIFKSVGLCNRSGFILN